MLTAKTDHKPLSLGQIRQQYSELLPSEKDIAFYQEHGWFIASFSLENTLIDKAITGAEEFYEGRLDRALKNNERIANSASDTHTVIQNNEFVTLQKKALAEVGFHPLVVATAAILSETEEIRLFADSLVNKKPSPEKKGNAVGWHTDKAYWPTCSSNNLLTAWIPFQDCTIDMGPLFHIDTSNHWRNNKALNSFYSFNNQSLGGLEEYLKSEVPDYKEVPMLLKKGQVAFHNCNTIHASRPNISKVNRMALAIHFQDQTNHYQKAYKGEGELISIGYDKLCGRDTDGNPDYRDPSIFPLLLTS